MTVQRFVERSVVFVVLTSIGMPIGAAWSLYAPNLNDSFHPSAIINTNGDSGGAAEEGEYITAKVKQGTTILQTAADAADTTGGWEFDVTDPTGGWTEGEAVFEIDFEGSKVKWTDISFTP